MSLHAGARWAAGGEVVVAVTVEGREQVIRGGCDLRAPLSDPKGERGECIEPRVHAFATAVIQRSGRRTVKQEPRPGAL